MTISKAIFRLIEIAIALYLGRYLARKINERIQKWRLDRREKHIVIEGKGYRSSQKGNDYHYPNCKWAQNISPKNLVIFGSAKDAQASGYVPCKVCNPSIKD